MLSRTIIFACVAIAVLSSLTENVYGQIDRPDIRLTTNLAADTVRGSGSRLSSGRGESSSSSFVMSGPSGQGTVIREDSGFRRDSNDRLSSGRGESSSSFVMSGPSGQRSVIREDSGSRRDSSDRLSSGRGESSSSFVMSGPSGQGSVMREDSGSRRDSNDRFSNNRGESVSTSSSSINSGRDSNTRGDRISSSNTFGNSNRDSTFTEFSGTSRPVQTNVNRDSINRFTGEISNEPRGENFRDRPSTEDNRFRNNRPVLDQSRGFHSFYEKPRGPYPYQTMYNYHNEYSYPSYGGYGRGPYRPGRFYGGYRRFRRSSGGDPEEHFFYANNWNV